MTSFQIAEVSKVKLPNKFSNMLFLFVCCAHFTIGCRAAGAVSSSGVHAQIIRAEQRSYKLHVLRSNFTSASDFLERKSFFQNSIFELRNA